MPNYSNITQIPAPRVELIDPRTGLMSREWFRFFNNIYTIVGANLGVIQIPNGGTGLSALPSNGQLLIGNNNAYSLNTLTPSTGISIVNGPGTIKITNTGLLSVAAGVGISIVTVNGISTIDNSGVLSLSGGTTGLTPSVATTGVVTLAGTLIAANGGTGYASYTIGDLLYADTSTTLAKLAGGVANNGKFLTIVAGVPAWSTNGSGDVTGPASSTDNAITRFDGTTGKLIQNSVTLIDDTGNASGILSQQFSNGSAVTLAAGKMWYDGSTGAWNAGMGGGNITQQIGEELFVYGKASAAITDSPLQIVYQTGTVGASGVITFAPTIASITDGTLILGVATESLALNDFGRITSYGVVRGITTNGTAFGETWADGDEIYYNPVTGNPTNVKPVAPNVKVSVGTLIKAGAGGSGSIQVEVNHGSVLGGTDANVQITSPANNQLLQYDSTAGYWKNVNASAVSTAAGGSTTQIQYNNAGALAGLTSFTTDGTNLTATGQLNLTNASNYNLYASGAGSNYMAGRLGIGATTLTQFAVRISKGLTGAVSSFGVRCDSIIQSDVTTAASYFSTSAVTAAASFTCATVNHFSATQGTLGASSVVTTQVGFSASSNLNSATNNYGFRGLLTAATGRFNLYMDGTAPNYFGGDMQVNKTVTAAGTTGAQTINKTAGTVNFAAAAASLVVTNSLVATTSIIIATVGTNDTTMKSVSAVAAAGSFTLHANAAATAETRVNFMVFN